jgi:predicted ATP-dependent serine protease
METYACKKCGMSVNATCGKCGIPLKMDTLH